MCHRAKQIDICPEYINNHDNAILFWRDTDILSNFYMCNAYMFNNHFKSAEHAYQWYTHFELYDLAEQVLKIKPPDRQNKLHGQLPLSSLHYGIMKKEVRVLSAKRQSTIMHGIQIYAHQDQYICTC